jgi:hypothetical protein
MGPYDTLELHWFLRIYVGLWVPIGPVLWLCISLKALLGTDFGILSLTSNSDKNMEEFLAHNPGLPSRFPIGKFRTIPDVNDMADLPSYNS